VNRWTLIAASLVVAVLITLHCRPADAGRYKPQRFCSQYVYFESGKPAGSLERCQDAIKDWAMEAGHHGPGNLEPVLLLDMPRADKIVERVIHLRPAGPDTVWFAPIASHRWTEGERTYVVVLGEGVEVPRSVDVVLADGSRFTQPIERKRK
jgi:hypothetical protein